MPNVLDATGLTLKTQAELVDEFTLAMQQIYGPDIDLSSSTPDGQMMMIFIQAVLDVQDLLMQIYNSFDPDNAVGNVLDQRVAINGIQRQGGTYTIQPVAITTDRAITLYGLDQEENTPYTVEDGEGNQWILEESIALPSADVYSLDFRSAVPGAVQSGLNTITVPVSIVIGVTSINNPSSYTTLGVNEESDVQLKIRRQQSVALSSQGYLDGLIAALQNISGITFTKVYENVTAITDSDGIPSHSIWVIVAGDAQDAEIASAIYRKRNAGCGMKGSVEYIIVQPDSSDLTIRWDIVEMQNLFIQFNATSLDGVNPPNISAIKAGLGAQYVPGVYEQVNVNALSTAVQDIDSNTLVTVAGFGFSSTNVTNPTLTPSAKNMQFSIDEDRIIILPMILNPVSNSIVHSSGSIAFTGLGGYGSYTYAFKTNSSGGSMNSISGVYTPGSSFPVTDVVKVTDSLNNTVSVSVAVT